MNQLQPYNSTGFMIVQAVSAGGAFPVIDAVVTINGVDPQNSDIHLVLRTDQSGKTDKIPLPTPPKELSLTPGNPSPYAKYNVSIFKEGYRLEEKIDIPVFSDITSIQFANMVPTEVFEPGS
ncbi:MAG: hypothetical protein WDA00_01590 [Eubacteriales bacterium]